MNKKMPAPLPHYPIASRIRHRVCYADKACVPTCIAMALNLDAEQVARLLKKRGHYCPVEGTHAVRAFAQFGIRLERVHHVATRFSLRQGSTYLASVGIYEGGAHSNVGNHAVLMRMSHTRGEADRL